jgi:hypothetical protein
MPGIPGAGKLQKKSGNFTFYIFVIIATEGICLVFILSETCSANEHQQNK